MFVNSHILLVTMLYNIKFSSIMNVEGLVATKEANGIKTTISAFTACQINIDMVVRDNNFYTVRKST